MISNALRGFGLVALLALGLGGCAAALPRPVETNAALGKVVVYRNGVAYFERYAKLEGKALKLRVPGERIDDLLKSLTVVDAATGAPIPVSFPTLEQLGDEVEISLQLPTPAPESLRLSYVTESPSWKPTYRLKLSKKGPAKLEAWAVVDNVSGEDWTRVAVGVGSTSALSFRYDLHSVRVVQRETLTDGELLGAAPPTGGSPYAVAGKELAVLANVSADDLLAQGDAPAAVEESEPFYDDAGPSSVGSGQGQGLGARRAAPSVRAPKPAKPRKSASVDEAVSAVVTRALQNNEKIRIEGFAVSGDQDRVAASLSRANVMRDRLLAGGLPADQVEVVGTGKAAQGEAVRILALQGEVKAEQPKPTSAADQAGDPIGDAFFLSPTPLTVNKGSSALVSILNSEVKAELVYYYDPLSARGSDKLAFRAALVENPSEHTLDAGPFTAYSEGQFLGEGMTDAIPAKSRAFIPFALDRSLIVETEEAGHEAIDRLLTVQRGIVTAEARSIRSTKLVLINRGTEPALTYVRHALAPGFKLEAPAEDFEKLRGAYLFKVTVPPGGSTTLNIEESTPIEKTVDVHTPSGVDEIALYLEAVKTLPVELREKLAQVIQMHRELADLDDRLSTIGTQIEMYRQRVDELNVQLMTLRKVPQAAQLSRSLAKKMDEISEQLQKATLESASIEGERLTRRVALEDRLAELTLESRKEAESPKAAGS
ncbi:MAG TPA: DUF4139 domain-containing protein [Polyangiaceae bacterium]|jgi:hypothetical protein|nr:DUF4139 domain-containing protein [Polyangiaceae bacterium]